MLIKYEPTPDKTSVRSQDFANLNTYQKTR